MTVLLLILSFFALLWSANHLVSGASGIAFHYRLSPLLMGFTLVALGTSAPEIMISITAALDGLNDIAIGNAIGTNIANIGLVLGLTVIIKPLRIESTILRREYPILFLVMLFTYSLMIDGYLGILDGCLFLLLCLCVIGYLIFETRQARPQRQLTLAFQKASLSKTPIKMHFFNLVIGLIVLPISARYLINSCITIGHLMGLSDLAIGLTVISIGSSLPELITSLIAISKGADDIAIGNILGANIFNLLAVMIFPSIIHPAAISHVLLWRDLPVMFITTGVLLWMNYRRQKKMERWQGGVLLLIYGCYMASVILNVMI